MNENRNINPTSLVANINQLIETAKMHVSRECNYTHVMLNWHIGTKVNQEILKNDRAEYGQNIINNMLHN